MAAKTEPSTELLDVGDQCSAQYCGLVDFLPFKCQHCERKFCGEHYLPASHKCEKYDEFKHNRVAPSCPLCNTPITIPLGQDPNVTMEHHITNECSVMTGRTKKPTQPHCANLRCKKPLFAPIRCDKCSQQFCPQHRFPSDHTCKSTTVQVQSKQVTTSTTSGTNTKGQEVSARTNAAMAAIKRSAASTKSTLKPTRASSSTPQPPQPVQNQKSSSSSTSSKTAFNPLSRTDRSPSSPNPPTTLMKRAPSTCVDDVANETKSGPTLRIRAERQSRLKAMEERAKKGLLSEEEKAILAAEKAKDKDGDCLIA